METFYLDKIEKSFIEFVSKTNRDPSRIFVSEDAYEAILNEFNTSVSGIKIKKGDPLFYRGVPIYASKYLKKDIYLLDS